MENLILWKVPDNTLYHTESVLQTLNYKEYYRMIDHPPVSIMACDCARKTRVVVAIVEEAVPRWTQFDTLDFNVYLQNEQRLITNQ